MQLELPIITFDPKTFLDIVIDSDNETSAAERDFFTYEPSTFLLNNTQSAVTYCYMNLFVLIIDLNRTISPPLRTRISRNE